MSTLVEQSDVTTQLPDDRFSASTQMFRLSHPPSAPVNDTVTMVIDPAALGGLRSEPMGYPFVEPAAPVAPSGRALPPSDRFALPKRAALIGTAVIAAALLVYFGRGLVAQSVETATPAELNAPSETIAADDLAAPIELAPPIEVAGPTAPLTAPLGSLPPLIDEHLGQPSVAAGATSPTEQLVAALSPSAEGATPSTSDETAANSASDATSPVAEPVAEPVATTSEEPGGQVATESSSTTTDQVAAVEPETVASQPAAESETATTTGETTATSQAVADESTGAAQPATASATSTDSTGGQAGQVALPPIAVQQIDRYGGEGARAAGQALSQVPQSATGAIQQGAALFSRR
jgi:hypothetical protein